MEILKITLLGVGAIFMLLAVTVCICACIVAGRSDRDKE